MANQDCIGIDKTKQIILYILEWFDGIISTFQISGSDPGKSGIVVNNSIVWTYDGFIHQSSIYSNHSHWKFEKNVVNTESVSQIRE